MPRVPKLTVYEDATGGWRWRLRTGNGRNIGNPGEAYVSERNAMRAAIDFKDSAGRSEIVIERKSPLAKAVKRAPAKKKALPVKAAKPTV